MAEHEEPACHRSLWDPLFRGSANATGMQCRQSWPFLAGGGELGSRSGAEAVSERRARDVLAGAAEIHNLLEVQVAAPQRQRSLDSEDKNGPAANGDG